MSINRNESPHRPPPNGATLMSLPSEIRSMILSSLLVSKTVVEPTALTTSLWPAVLQVCKQLNVEGSHLLYTKNIFQLSEARRAVQFLSLDYRITRSMIREITICFATGRRHLNRSDHPVQDHVAMGHQPSYHDLRLLAASMHQWSITLANIPPNIQTIRLLPYSFSDCCNHVQFGWPPTSTWFCPGCGLRQFCEDNKLEDFLPTTATRHDYGEQDSRMVIACQPNINRNMSRQQLRARQEYLSDVATGAISRIENSGNGL